MTTSRSGAARRLRQLSGRVERARRDERGLTTLEWLLIVAAVAGLAALAVVIVQNVVSDTAEQIAGNNARKTAATLHAQQITDEARSKTARRDGRGDDYEELNRKYKQDCKTLLITYGDVPDLRVWWHTDISDPNNPPTRDKGVDSISAWNGTSSKPQTFGCIVSTVDGS